MEVATFRVCSGEPPDDDPTEVRNVRALYGPGPAFTGERIGNAPRPRARGVAAEPAAQMRGRAGPAHELWAGTPDDFPFDEPYPAFSDAPPLPGGGTWLGSLPRIKVSEEDRWTPARDGVAADWYRALPGNSALAQAQLLARVSAWPPRPPCASGESKTVEVLYIALEAVAAVRVDAHTCARCGHKLALEAT